MVGKDGGAEWGGGLSSEPRRMSGERWRCNLRSARSSVMSGSGAAAASLFLVLCSVAPCHPLRSVPCAARRGRGLVASASATIDALRKDQDQAIIARGIKERACLQQGAALVSVKQRGGVSGGGMGGGMGGGGMGGGASKAKAKAKAKATKKTPSAVGARSALAKEMASNGVVRIDAALSPETADALRAFVDAEKLRAEEEVARGTHAFDTRFADLVLVSNRSDFLLPLRGVVIDALQELLGEGSVLGPLIEELMGSEGVLQEVACLISYPGSEQQPLHPDTPYSNPPSLYASFIALQDVDEQMGPTLFLPGTHTKAAHAAFYGGDLIAARETNGVRTAPVAEAFLRSRPVALGLLNKGGARRGGSGEPRLDLGRAVAAALLPPRSCCRALAAALVGCGALAAECLLPKTECCCLPRWPVPTLLALIASLTTFLDILDGAHPTSRHAQTSLCTTNKCCTADLPTGPTACDVSSTSRSAIPLSR